MKTEFFVLSKRYKSTEVDLTLNTWLHVPSGNLWSTSSDTHQIVEIKRLMRSMIESKYSTITERLFSRF